MPLIPTLGRWRQEEIWLVRERNIKGGRGQELEEFSLRICRERIAPLGLRIW